MSCSSKATMSLIRNNNCVRRSVHGASEETSVQQSLHGGKLAVLRIPTPLAVRSLSTGSTTTRPAPRLAGNSLRPSLIRKERQTGNLLLQTNSHKSYNAPLPSSIVPQTSAMMPQAINVRAFACRHLSSSTSSCSAGGNDPAVGVSRVPHTGAASRPWRGTVTTTLSVKRTSPHRLVEAFFSAVLAGVTSVTVALAFHHPGATAQGGSGDTASFPASGGDSKKRSTLATKTSSPNISFSPMRSGSMSTMEDDDPIVRKPYDVSKLFGRRCIRSGNLAPF